MSESNRNITIHLEHLPIEIFEELNLKFVEWDFYEEGAVLCLIISDKPHRMITVFLTHQQIKELFETYQKHYGQGKKK